MDPKDLNFSKIIEHRVDGFEGNVYLLTNFRTRQNNLSTHKDKQNDFRLYHSVNQSREQFRLVRAEVMMARGEALEAYGKLDITGANNVLNLKIRKLSIESKLLNNASVFARGKLGIILRFGTRNNHLAGRENECSGFRFANTHDNSGETLKVTA